MTSQLGSGGRSSQDDFDLHPSRTANYIHGNAIARIHAAEQFLQLTQQLNALTRGADDKVLRLQASLLRRPVLADAGDAHASARIVKGDRAKVDSLRGRWPVGLADVRFQSSKHILRRCRRANAGDRHD